MRASERLIQPPMGFSDQASSQDQKPGSALPSEKRQAAALAPKGPPLPGFVHPATIPIRPHAAVVEETQSPARASAQLSQRRRDCEDQETSGARRPGLLASCRRRPEAAWAV